MVYGGFSIKILTIYFLLALAPYCFCLQRLIYLSSWPLAPSKWKPGADPPCSPCTAQLRSPWSRDWCYSGGTLGPAWPFPHLNSAGERRARGRKLFNQSTFTSPED